MHHQPRRAPDRVVIDRVCPTSATWCRPPEAAPSAPRWSARRASVHADDLLDLGLRGEQVRRRSEESRRTGPRGSRRRRCAPAGSAPTSRGSGGVEADLLERLPARGVGGRLPLVHEPARERHLAGVTRERVGADREDQGRSPATRRAARGRRRGGRPAPARAPAPGPARSAGHPGGRARVASAAMVGEDVAGPASTAADAAASAAADAIDPDEVLRYARALIAAPSENPGGTEDEVGRRRDRASSPNSERRSGSSAPKRGAPASWRGSARASARASRGTGTWTPCPRGTPRPGRAVRSRARSSTAGSWDAGRAT